MFRRTENECDQLVDTYEIVQFFRCRTKDMGNNTSRLEFFRVLTLAAKTLVEPLLTEPRAAIMRVLE